MTGRQKQIWDAFNSLGGVATVKQLAVMTSLNARGVSQTMGAFGRWGWVYKAEGEGIEAVWILNLISQDGFGKFTCLLRGMEKVHSGMKEATTTQMFEDAKKRLYGNPDIAMLDQLSFSVVSSVLSEMRRRELIARVGGTGRATVWRNILGSRL